MVIQLASVRLRGLVLKVAKRRERRGEGRTFPAPWGSHDPTKEHGKLLEARLQPEGPVSPDRRAGGDEQGQRDHCDGRTERGRCFLDILPGSTWEAVAWKR
jgi:hypothetical protein